MRGLLACLAATALVPAGLYAQERGAGSARVAHGGYANPSAAIAAEIAFARLARDKGQWTAFRATAAPDAVMFTPSMVLAHTWLKDRRDPAPGLAWQPHQVWSSCDGSLMVTSGAWQNGEKHGWFTTVWARQEKGEYKWVFDHGSATAEPLPAPEMISAKVADCPDRPGGARTARPAPGTERRRMPRPKAPPASPFDPSRREGRSRDGTLTWQVTADASGNHEFVARLLADGRLQDVRTERVTATRQ